MVNKRVRNAVLGGNLKNDRMISVCFHGKPFNITVNQAYAPTSNVEEAEVEWFYEDLQDLLELTPKKDVLFIIGDWNAKVESQETPGVTGKFGLGVQNEVGQRLIEFCQENTVVIANTPMCLLWERRGPRKIAPLLKFSIFYKSVKENRQDIKSHSFKR